MRIILEISDSDIPKEQDIIMIPIHFIDGTVCEAGGHGFCILEDTTTIIEADKAESEDKGVLEQLAEKQNNLLAINKAWSDAIEKNGYVN